MASKITCRVDCTSLYSYFAFTYLLTQRSVLSTHNVTIDFIPVFIGGIMVGSENKPPWMVPAKATYGEFDMLYAERYFGLPGIKKPSAFPILSLKPQRALCYIKDHYPRDKFEEAMRLLWAALWQKDIDVSQEPLLVATWANLFTPEECKAILEAANTAEYKQKLLDNTEEALKAGAFGAPWFTVRNSKGEETPFFGSDRFHFMYQFLGLPTNDMVVQVGPGTSKL